MTVYLIFTKTGIRGFSREISKNIKVGLFDGTF